MNNYEYVEIARKLSENDDRKNLITGLIITTIVLGGITYLQYRSNQSIKEKNTKLLQSNTLINDEIVRKSHQNARLIFEKYTLQETIKKLKEKNELLATKIQETDIQKNNV